MQAAENLAPNTRWITRLGDLAVRRPDQLRRGVADTRRVRNMHEGHVGSIRQSVNTEKKHRWQSLPCGTVRKWSPSVRSAWMIRYIRSMSSRPSTCRRAPLHWEMRPIAMTGPSH